MENLNISISIFNGSPPSIGEVRQRIASLRGSLYFTIYNNTTGMGKGIVVLSTSLGQSTLLRECQLRDNPFVGAFTRFCNLIAPLYFFTIPAGRKIEHAFSISHIRRLQRMCILNTCCIIDIYLHDNILI